MTLNDLFISLTNEDKAIIVKDKSANRLYVFMDSCSEQINLQEPHGEEPPILFIYPNWREYVREQTFHMCEYDC